MSTGGLAASFAETKLRPKSTENGFELFGRYIPQFPASHSRLLRVD